MRLSTKIWRGVSLRSILIGIVMALAIIAFTVTGVTTSLSGLDQNVAAQVGSQVVSMTNLQLAVQRQNRRELPDNDARLNALRTTLDSMIQELVVVEEATRIGWGANDTEVAAWLKKIPIFQDEKTNSFDRKRYENFIRSGQMSELDLFREGRQSLSTLKYSTLLNLDSHLPSKLAEDYARRAAASFQIEFLELVPSQETINEAVRKKATEFMADTKNAAELEKAYDARKAEFNQPESPRISAILIAHKEASQAQGDALNRSREDARRLAEETLNTLKSGGDFAELANKLSDDVKTRTSKNGGDLGFVNASVLDPAALDASKALAADGDLSGIVDTAFGLRILKRTGHRPAVNRPLDSVKTELAESIVRPEVTATQKQDIAAAFEPLLAADKSAEREAKATELKLSWQPVKEPITPSSRFVAELGPADPIIRHLFKLRNPKDVIPNILSVSGKNVIVRLVARTDKKLETADVDAARDIQTAQARNRFATEARRKLYDIYSQNKEIRRNASLFVSSNSP